MSVCVQTSSDLAGKKILLGVTGGIAAYKCAELVRLLKKVGADVVVGMTDAATRFVTPLTFQALSGHPVAVDAWDPEKGGGMTHIDLTRSADLILIAPASADFLAKMAQGRADDLLSALVLARDCDAAVAPAMNRQMWGNPATQRNMALLREDGVAVWGPGVGVQACGETGEGRMLEPCELLEAVVGALTPKRWAKRAVTRNLIKRQVYNVSASFGARLKPTAYVVRLRTEFDRKYFVSASSLALKQAVKTELTQLFAKIATP